MKKHVTIVDDDELALHDYVRTLDMNDYSVQTITDMSLCRPLISQPPTIETDMFVLDIMMNPGGLYDAERTDNGRATGLYLAKDIRNVYRDTPILIWSNSTSSTLVGNAEQLAKSLTNCAFICKFSYPCDEFVSFIDAYFDNNEFRSGFFRTLWDSLLLAPNFSGLGVDLRKLHLRKRSR